MTIISDLSLDLVEEILSKVPITSLKALRSTCKRWNSLSKDRILCKVEASQQFLGFMIKDFRVCSLRFDLHGIHNEDGKEFFEPSTKKISSFGNQICKVFHCYGLLLCITRDNTSLMVWNPYLGQTRLIQPRTSYQRSDRYALGYDNNNKNRNYKLLRYSRRYDRKSKKIMVECEIYDFKSDSWRDVVVDVTRDWDIMLNQHNASLKGNTYFFATVENRLEEDEFYGKFICFDFTTEKFGQFLHPPESHQVSYLAFEEFKTLSSLREEKLVALFQNQDTFEIDIWVTIKIEPNSVSWSKFLRIDMEAFTICCDLEVASFFIEEEKKLAVVFDLGINGEITKPEFYDIAYISGENGCLREVDLGTSMNFGEAPRYGCPVVCSSSYVPSLVQINQITGSERKEKKRKQN